MSERMTLEEQLQSMAGTSSERQLIQRWLQRSAANQPGRQLETSRAMIGPESAAESGNVDSQTPATVHPSS